MLNRVDNIIYKLLYFCFDILDVFESPLDNMAITVAECNYCGTFRTSHQLNIVSQLLYHPLVHVLDFYDVTTVEEL